jgi:hypothetical protein
MTSEEIRRLREMGERGELAPRGSLDAIGPDDPRHPVQQRLAEIVKNDG